MAPTDQFRIRIASDHLSATIRVACEPVPKNLSATDVEAALKEANIAINDGVPERIEGYVRMLDDARRC